MNEQELQAAGRLERAMHMHVYISSSKTPIVIETNLAWAYPYWEARKRLNPKIHWKLQ